MREISCTSSRTPVVWATVSFMSSVTIDPSLLPLLLLLLIQNDRLPSRCIHSVSDSNVLFVEVSRIVSPSVSSPAFMEGNVGSFSVFHGLNLAFCVSDKLAL